MTLILGDIGFRFCLTFWMLMWKFLRFSWFCVCWWCFVLWRVMIPGVGGFGSWNWKWIFSVGFGTGVCFLLFDARVGNRNGFRRCGNWGCGLWFVKLNSEGWQFAVLNLAIYVFVVSENRMLACWTVLVGGSVCVILLGCWWQVLVVLIVLWKHLDFILWICFFRRSFMWYVDSEMRKFVLCKY